MQFQIVSHKDIDINKWDNLLIDHNATQSQYSSFDYISSCCENWSAFIYGDYVSAFPFAHKNKMGYQVVFQPFFTRNFPFLGKDNKGFIDEVFQYLYENYNHLDINLAVQLNYSFLKTKKFFFQGLELDKDYDLLHQAFSKNTKRILKKAQKLTIQNSDDIKAFLTLFKNTVGNKLNYKEENYNALYNVIKNGISNNTIEFLKINKENEVLGYAVFQSHGNIINFIKGAVTNNGKKLGAMHVLINYCILQNANANKVLDFGGSNIKGVAEFYKKFGATDFAYYNYSFDRLPTLLKKFKRIRAFLFKKV